VANAVADELARYISQLGVPTYATVRRREMEDYVASCGLDALKRQIELGQLYHRCCWEPADSAHHPICRTRK